MGADQSSVISVYNEGITTLTLNKPEQRNALSDDLLLDLITALNNLKNDLNTKVVVLTGADPVFCAGAVAKVRPGMSAEEKGKVFSGPKSQFRRLFEQATGALQSLEQVTVAQINGHAVGGGWGLALTCDFRVASDEAKFWIPEVELGVLLGVGTTTRLVRLLGAAKAKEIVLLCERMSAQDAKDLGALTDVASRQDLELATGTLADKLVQKPFKSLAEMKARINMIEQIGMPAVNAMTDGFLER